MRKDHYLGMRVGDLDGKPYAPYWNPDMKPLPPHVREALMRGHEAAELGLSLDQADRLMDAGYLPLETGTTELPNGQVFVAALTHMPRVTGPMFEWWMGWHYMEHQRYKLWHPRAHVANGTEAMQGDDPNLSDREKYRTTHHVTEYLGNRLEAIKITFYSPETFFGKTRDFEANQVTALVCGKVELQRAPITIGHLIHQIRQVEGGAEMRSRFWLGLPRLSAAPEKGLRNRIIGSKWFARRLMDPNLGRTMLVHCGMEMNHLASFLPDLHADYHGEPSSQQH